MSLFDDVLQRAGSLTSQLSPEHQTLANGVLDMLKNNSGVAGLVQQFQNKGLGDVVSSWVGNGQNQPISADQVQSVLGGVVNDIAAKAGISPEQASSGLAQILPKLIDHLTPQGQAPQQSGDAIGDAASFLKSKLG